MSSTATSTADARGAGSGPGDRAHEQVHMAEAIRRTLSAEMARDPSVVAIAEPSPDGGFSFGAGAGLRERHGAARVLELPASETLLVQTAIGLALSGARPVLELAHADFALSAFEPIAQEAALARFRSGGAVSCPLVVRLPYGGASGGGPLFSGCHDAMFAAAPGLTVLAASGPADAARLLRHAIRSDDPVVLLEPKALLRGPREAVPHEAEGAEDELRARLVRDGEDAVCIAWGAMVPECVRAAESCEAEGISVAVLDLRSLSPLDEDAVVAAVAGRGRVVVVEEGPRTGGFGGEVAACVADRALLHLEAPVVRVSSPDAPLPFAREDLYRPDARRIAAAIEQVVDF